MAIDLVIIVGLIVVNGLLAGAEMATVTLRRTRLESLVDDGSHAAKIVQRLRTNPERLLATVQIGITVCSAAAGAFGGERLAGKFAPMFQSFDVTAPYADALALAAVVILVSYLTLVVGELVPKSLALRAPERYALVVAQPLFWLSRIAKPVVWALTASSNAVLKVFGDRTSFAESRLSADELKAMVDEARAQGSLDPRVGEIAVRSFDLERLTASDVMVPRRRMAALSTDATLADLRALVGASGHGRVPIYDDSIDDIVGYIPVREVFVRGSDEHVALFSLARPVVFIPETMHAPDVLFELQKKGAPIAIVVDEHGGTAGMLTREDLVEEIVGEVLPSTGIEARRRPRLEPDGSALVPGGESVRDVNRALGFSLPEDGAWTSVGGLVMHKFGAIPFKGDRITLDDQTVLVVVEASPRRVRLVQVIPPLAPPAHDGDAGAQTDPATTG